MIHYTFLLNPSSTPEQALIELYPILSDIYEVEENGATLFGGYAEHPLTQTFTHVTLQSTSSEIDWEKQWQDFAPDFHHGLAHIPINSHTLLLQPGAGFGDYSHPTTRLALSLLTPLVPDKIFFDIGCGSGILSLAAILLGAKKAYGIDIDPAAIAHSQQNATLNKIQAQFSTELDPAWIPDEPCVIAMNMIVSQQHTAWESVPSNLYGWIVTSGILASQREEYLAFAKQNGWVLIKEIEEEGWLGFVFRQGREEKLAG